MNRNWAASENPRRRFKPTARHLRDVALRRATAIPPARYPVRAPIETWRDILAFVESVENIYNRTVEGV